VYGTTLFIIVIRKQIAFGFKEPGENADAQVFLKQMFSRLTEMLDCRELNFAIMLLFLMIVLSGTSSSSNLDGCQNIADKAKT
jgi:hypothetical protein